MARFFVEMNLAVGETYDLPADVVRHINVLRLRVSDEIKLFNGDGHDYVAKFVLLEKRQIQVVILSALPVVNESPLRIHLLVALIANDKFDWVLQKAVELGVSQITPIYSQNTQRFKGERLESRLLHWQKIIIAASEQSGRATLVELQPPQELVAAMKSTISSTQKYILSPHHAGEFAAIDQSLESVALLIGPEGGFTESEVELANKAGFQSVMLGKRILRAETAALAGICVLQSRFGDFVG